MHLRVIYKVCSYVATGTVIKLFLKDGTKNSGVYRAPPANKMNCMSAQNKKTHGNQQKLRFLCNKVKVCHPIDF